MARRTQSDWLALFQAFEQSGLTQAAFCAQHDINATYFSSRRTQLLVTRQSTAFVTAVPEQVSASSSSMATLHYGKISLQIPVHEMKAIAQLMKALA